MRRKKAVRRARGDVGTRENLVLDRLDDGLQFLRLGITVGERAFEILETEMASVEHHRVDVTEDLFEVVVAYQVQFQVGRLRNRSIVTDRRTAPQRTGLGVDYARRCQL